MHESLFQPLKLGSIDAPNRIFMAPLTRARATMPGKVPNDIMADYYRQRAGAGLIIAEATPISPRADGYYSTPGIFTDEQTAAWRTITDAVHDAGGRIVLQLWHVGRVSHHKLQPNNDKPVSSTDVPADSKTYVDDSFERIPCSPPRVLETEEIPEIVEEFAAAARRAKDAGFDGVEIHGANSYLLDQFTRDGVNKRNDIYGGPLENRLRLPLQVAQAVVGAWDDAGCVGYRISPLSEHKDVRDSDPERTFSMLARGLGELGLAYIHAVETWDRANIDPRAQTVIPRITESFKNAGGGTYIANGDYTPELAADAVSRGWADAIALGRLWIPNPDLATRIHRGGPYRDWDQSTFYGGGPEGYSDYQPLDAEQLAPSSRDV